MTPRTLILESFLETTIRDPYLRAVQRRIDTDIMIKIFPGQVVTLADSVFLHWREPDSNNQAIGRGMVVLVRHDQFQQITHDEIKQFSEDR